MMSVCDLLDASLRLCRGSSAAAQPGHNLMNEAPLDGWLMLSKMVLWVVL